MLSGVHTQPFMAMARAGLIDKIGVDNTFDNVKEALKAARDLVGAQQTKREEAAGREIGWELAVKRN